MIRVEIKHLTEGRTEVFFGTEKEVKDELRSDFPEARPFFTIAEIVQAINDYGTAEVEVKPYRPSESENQLPDGFLTHQEEEPDRR